MKVRQAGFTIVELLIVIIVISILTTVIVISYRGAQDRADTSARLAEMKEWQKIFIAYGAQYNRYPPYTGAPDGNASGADLGWCLGTGFPVTGSDTSAPRGSGNCRDLDGGLYKYYVNTQLNAELRKVSPSLPTGPRTPPSGRFMGPFMKYYMNLDGTNGNIEIFNMFKGTTCPDGTKTGYLYSSTGPITCVLPLDPLQ